MKRKILLPLLAFLSILSTGNSLFGQVLPEDSLRRPIQSLSDCVCPDTAVSAAGIAAFTPLRKERRTSGKDYRPRLALKTDFVLWGGVMPDFRIGAVTPNLSAELYFAGRWSVEGGYAYSDWKGIRDEDRLYAVSGGYVSPRLWFRGGGRFRGMFVGAYGQYGQYDVQDSPQGGHTGNYAGAGLSAGVVLPFCRHWLLEFSVKGGWLNHRGESYETVDGHHYFRENETGDRLAASAGLKLVYRFGRAGRGVQTVEKAGY